MAGLHGPEENRNFLLECLETLKPKLPCTRKHAIAYLAWNVGHTPDYLTRTFLTVTLELGILREKNGNLVLGDEIEYTGELPRDENGNHIKEDKET